MENQDKVSKHYKGEAAARYVSMRQSNPESIGYALNVEYFAPYIRPGDSVLDFGCGNGGMIPHLIKLAKHVVGLEVSPEARSIAEKTGVRIVAGLDDLNENDVFDVIVSNHVLEHVPNVVEVLTKLRKHIKPGGLFVTKLPYDDIRCSHQCSWSKDDVDHHLQTWSPRLFANVLYESGYEVKDIHMITSAWHPKLFPLTKIGLHRFAFWIFAILKARRQLFAAAVVPNR